MENSTSLSGVARRRFVICLYLAVFLSAFLLFQVQPLIGKAILPWFGGSPAVWTTSMLFFQVALCAGYCGAHFMNRYLTSGQQLVLYLAMFLAAIVLLPIYPNQQWKPDGTGVHPTWHILGLLGLTVGIPFLLLAVHGPLLQTWWYRIVRQSPYRLYALSNAGSLLGLVTYPFIVEPRLDVRRQAWLWSLAFVGLGLLVAATGLVAGRCGAGRLHRHAQHTENAVISGRLHLSWMILSAVGSVLLLSMTNHLSQNVAVVPFLWVAPLTLYLLSFILAFAEPGFYRRGVVAGFMGLITFVCACWYNYDVVGNVFILLMIHLAALFAGCMLCHGELARLKPAPSKLTSFYITISIGGAVGGLLVGLVAPLIFLRYYEYPLALIACWLIMIVVLLRDEQGFLHRGRSLWAWGMILCCFVAFLFQLQQGMIKRTESSLVTVRDFYGVITVRRTRGEDGRNDWFELSHGTVVHGAQYVDEEKQFEPTTYYVRQSGIGYTMRPVAGRPARRVGVVGLGVGTVAAYCESGDYFRAYEIDPNVIQLAAHSNIFTFWSLLEQRGARGQIIAGDARISLERELALDNRQAFDVLVLDAFSGDAVPVHLLTREAFAVYFQHLAPDGVIAIHISNSHLNLVPVIRGHAADRQADLAAVIDPGRSDWLLMSRPGVMHRLFHDFPDVISVSLDGPRVMWTDERSGIFGILK